MIRKIVSSLLLLAALAYGIIFWLSLPRGETVREFPWWEDYADYWKGDWVRLSSQIYQQGYEPTEDVHCLEVANSQCAGWTVSEIHICFDDSNKSASRTVWKRYGLFGILTGYKSWSEDEYLYNENPQNGLFRWFPNGPNSLLTPREPKPEKVIIERPITDAEIVDAFIKIATELEYDPYGNEQRIQPINKRTSPVRLIVDDFSNGTLFDGKTVKQWVDELLIELSALTGIDMKRIERGTEPENAVVAFLYESQREAFLAFVEKTKEDEQKRHIDTGYFMGLEEMQKKLYRKDSRCFGKALRIIETSEIINGNVFIFLDKTTNVPGCIHEEIIQGLGLMNDVREINLTTFNDYSPHRFATLLDKILLQMLYDVRIKPGMTADEARPVAETIVKEYRAQGKLNQIMQRVYRP